MLTMVSSFPTFAQLPSLQNCDMTTTRKRNKAVAESGVLAAITENTYSACDPFWLKMVENGDCRCSRSVGSGGKMVGQKDSKQSALDQHEARSTHCPPRKVASLHASLRSVPRAPGIDLFLRCYDSRPGPVESRKDDHAISASVWSEKCGILVDDGRSSWSVVGNVGIR